MAIATVIAITGRAWARDEEGNVRELRVGDTLQEGEVLVTSDNGSAQLDFGDGLAAAVIEGGEQVVMMPELDANEPADPSEFAALDEDLEALLSALDDEDTDLLDVLDATAAGAGPGGAADGGHTFVRLARIAEETDPLAFEYGMTDSSGLPEADGAAFLLVQEASPEPVRGEVLFEIQLLEDGQSPNPGQVEGEGGRFYEGNSFLVVATVSSPPVGGPLTIILSNGQVIIIPEGETSGSVVLETRPDDPHVQGLEQISLTVIGTEGGGYDELTVGDISPVTVVDDSDATTITLSAPSQVTEGGQISVTATVNNAPQGSPLVIELSNGEQITIAVGETSGSVSFDSRADDAYAQGTGTLELSITDTDGGNYEALDTSSTATVDVVDDSDTVTATLSSDVTSVAEGGQVTYTVTLTGPDGADLTGHDGLEFRLADGSIVTIAAGEISGSTTVTAADDAFAGGQAALVNSIDAVLSDSGSEFENLATAGETTVTVTDEPGTPGNPGTPNGGDPITVSIAATSEQFTEAQQQTFKVSLSEAVDRDVTITLDGGNTVTIEAGETEATYTRVPQGDDVLKDGETVTVALEGATAADGTAFENLTLGEAAQAQIVDTIDTVTATLSANTDSVAEGGTVTYTVTLTGPDGADLTGHDGLEFRLADGSIVTIAAGEISGSTTVTAADDAFAGGQAALVNSIDAVLSDSGSEFENLATAGET
ncbi:retention module-containing protein, partial [Billgrantia sp. LNSP4103-1]|uniref:retention module-containing protein n=1 Tax=Billgrantia sp. LNSP4103-1 TaxID=3410266 RepID=UPI00403FAFFF